MMKSPSVEATDIKIPLEDADVVGRCRRGEIAAFGRLIQKYQDRVFNTVWRMCGNRSDAEDLTQEAFVKALESINRFDGRSSFYTWVFRIAVNLALTARRKGRRAAIYSLNETGDRPDGGWTRAQRMAASDTGPEARACERERGRIVLEALASLDNEHRAVVVLRDLESLGYDEIAEILGIPAGTVKSRLHRARLALRQKLTPLLGTM